MKKTVYISGSITNPATGQPRDGWQKDFPVANPDCGFGWGEIVNFKDC